MATPSGVEDLAAQGRAGPEPTETLSQETSAAVQEIPAELPPKEADMGCNGDVPSKGEAPTVEADGRASAEGASTGAGGAETLGEVSPLQKEVNGASGGVAEVAAEAQKPETAAPTDAAAVAPKAKEGSPGGTSAAAGDAPAAPEASRAYYKKRKVCLFVAYKGAGYQGMQRNPGAKTIEGALEKALFRAGAILEEDLGELWRINWMRAARTDKGVSALAQVVSARLVLEPEGFVERVNKHLPKQIRVLGYVRVTAGFNAKELCDRRRYEYYLPTFAFDPNAHRAREPDAGAGAAPAAPASGAEGAGAGGAQEQGNSEASAGPSGKANAEGGEGTGAVEGGLAKAGEAVEHSGNGATAPEATGAKAEGAAAAAFPWAPDESGQLAKKQKLEAATNGTDGGAEGAKGGGAPGAQDNGAPAEGPDEGTASDQRPDGGVPGSAFVFDAACLGRLNELLLGFKGTHCFHNYTAGITAFDSAAHRFIVSFEATGVVEVAGMPLVRLVVVGQSFLLHQIRKMVGMAVAIMRGHCPPTLLKDALRKDKKMNVPMAPEVGLLLAECFYHSYNRKWSKTHEEVGLERWQGAVDEFKQTVVLPHIVDTERQEHTVAKWLSNLNDRNYRDFALARAAAEGKL